MAYMRFDESDYTQYVDVSKIDELNKAGEEKVFSEILQDKEEKKTQQIQDKTVETQIYSRIKSLHIEGKQDEEIARMLNVGIGEVQLILSLYKMR